MGNLDDAMIQDQHALLDLDEYGETITYKRSGKPDRTIRAVVERIDQEPVAGSGVAQAPVINIVFLNEDSDDGIQLVDLGSDSVVLVARLGQAPSERQLDRILNHDAAYWRVRLR